MKTDTIDKLLFILEAQLFHKLNREEALMLWDDNIISLHDRAETIN